MKTARHWARAEGSQRFRLSISSLLFSRFELSRLHQGIF